MWRKAGTGQEGKQGHPFGDWSNRPEKVVGRPRDRGRAEWMGGAAFGGRAGRTWGVDWGAWDKGKRVIPGGWMGCVIFYWLGGNVGPGNRILRGNAVFCVHEVGVACQDLCGTGR